MTSKFKSAIHANGSEAPSNGQVLSKVPQSFWKTLLNKLIRNLGNNWKLAKLVTKAASRANLYLHQARISPALRAPQSMKAQKVTSN